MIRQIFRPYWEIIVSDEIVTTAERLFTNTLDPINAHYEKIRKQIAIYRADKRTYVRCAHCRTPLFAKTHNNGNQYGFTHHSKLSPNPEIMAICPYYTSESHINSLCTKEETAWRTDSKYSVYDQLKQDSQIDQDSIKIGEFIFSQDDDENRRRKPDLSFTDRNGNKFAIEFYRAWINTQIAHDREMFFRRQGINLLWLFPSDTTKHFVKNSRSMKMHVMYGQFSNDPKVRKFSTTTASSNNVFCYESPVITSAEFSFDCIYPVYQIANPENFPEITTTAKYCRQRVTLKDLSLEPTHRLPIAVDTRSNQRLQRDLIAQLTNDFRQVHRKAMTMNRITADDFDFVSKALPNKIDKAEQLSLYLSNPLAQSRLTAIIKALALFQRKAIDKAQRLQYRQENKGARRDIVITLRKLRTLALSTRPTNPPSIELTDDFLDAATIYCLVLSSKAKKRGFALVNTLRSKVPPKPSVNDKDKYHISNLRENFEYKPDTTRQIDSNNITLADCYRALQPVLDAEKMIDRILYNTAFQPSTFENTWPDVESLITEVNPSLITLLFADLSKFSIDDADKFRYAHIDLMKAIRQFRDKRDLYISRKDHSQNHNSNQNPKKVFSAYSKIRG